ncbi:SRPBCC family protein [Brucella sp. LJL56]
MTDRQEEPRGKGIELEYALDAAPQKVWRAISIPEFRENWLPSEALADPEPASCKPGEEISYRMRESEPPFLESMVTFRIVPGISGGTCLRVIHELNDTRLKRVAAVAANSNRAPMMLAA